MFGLDRAWGYLSHPGMRNSGAIAIAKGSIMALRTGFLLWVAHEAGPGAFGRLALCVSTTELLRIAADFGTQTLSIRRIARAKDVKECAGHLIAMCRFRALSTIGCVLLYFGIVTAVFSGHIHMLDILPVGLLVTSLATSLPLTFYQAKLEMNRAIAPILGCGALFIVYSLAFGKYSIVSETAGLVVYEAVAAIILIVAVFRRVGINIHALWYEKLNQTIGGLAHECLPIAGGALLATVYTRIDVYAVKAIAGAVALGLYSYAFRLTEPFRYLALSIEASLYSHLSAKLAGHSPKLPRFGLIAKLVLTYSLGFSVIAYILGIGMTRLFFPGYGVAAPTILVLCCALFLRCVNGYQTAVQNALGRYRLTGNFSVVSFFVTMALIYPLTKDYGFLGAALTLLIMETLNFLLQGYFYRRSVIALRRGYA